MSHKRKKWELESSSEDEYVTSEKRRSKKWTLQKRERRRLSKGPDEAPGSTAAISDQPSTSTSFHATEELWRDRREGSQSSVARSSVHDRARPLPVDDSEIAPGHFGEIEQRVQTSHQPSTSAVHDRSRFLSDGNDDYEAETDQFGEIDQRVQTSRKRTDDPYDTDDDSEFYEEWVRRTDIGEQKLKEWEEQGGNPKRHSDSSSPTYYPPYRPASSYPWYDPTDPWDERGREERRRKKRERRATALRMESSHVRPNTGQETSQESISWRDRPGRRQPRDSADPSSSFEHATNSLNTSVSSPINIWRDRTGTPSRGHNSPSRATTGNESVTPSVPFSRRNPPRACRSLYSTQNVAVQLPDVDVPDVPDDDVYEDQRERDINRRSQYPRVTGAEQRRRALRAIETSDSEDDHGEIKMPEILLGEQVCHLGDKNGLFDIRCPFCGALDFKTIYKKDKHKKDIPDFIDSRDLICCDAGKVFVPPMKKRPEAIEKLSEARKTKSMLVSYNTCFSFASIQYHKIPAAPFGLPVAKTLGPIRHFASAALPFDPKSPRFGNYYLYTGNEAVNLRMQGFSHLDKKVVKDLQEALQVSHPFAKTLRTMGEIIEQAKLSNEDENMVRLRIIDAKRVPRSLLQGSHPGLYRDPLQCGDSVSIFYSATKEQDVFPPGLIIYPRKNNRVQMPIFPWDPRINTFCYPLLFPFGEYGFRQGKIKLVEDPTVCYERRLLEWAEKSENRAIAGDWDLDHTLQEVRDLHPIPHVPSWGDPNMHESAVEDVEEDEEEEDDDSYDQHLHQEEVFHDTGNHERQEMVVRGGQRYPRHRIIDEDDDEEEEDDEENFETYDQNGTFQGILRVPSPTTAGPQEIDVHGDVEGADLTPDQQVQDLFDVLDRDDYPMEGSSSIHPPPANTDDSDEHSDGCQAGGEINNDQDDSDVDAPSDRQLELDPSERDEVQHRKTASLRQFALYIHQQRKIFKNDTACARNRFSSSGKLGQVFLLDLATRIYQARSQYQRQHHTEFCTSTRTKFLKALQRAVDRRFNHQKIGCVSTVPQSVAGSPRHLQQLYEHTVAMSRTRRGKPDLFITFTTNVNWPEIKNNLPPGDTWNDHPQLVNKVFKKRLEKMLDKVVGKRIEKGRSLRMPGMFGRARWFSYSIEFQQRGPPHAHLVVSLKNHIKTAEEIDRVCQAELPELDGTEEMQVLRELVEDFMIHRPCEGDDKAYCRQNIKADRKECKKHFPKPFNETTRFGDCNYPELRRRNNGQRCALNPEADNRYVVPYNRELLTFFRAHVNVEVVSNLSVVKYIFKYVFKGYDRVLIEAITSMSTPDHAAMTSEGHLIYPKSIKVPPAVMKQREIQARKLLRDNGIDPIDENGQKVLVYDEFAMVEDQRALTGCEAAWDIQAFPRHGQSHTVVDLFVHAEGEEPIFYKKEDQQTKAAELQRGGEIKTRFKEWFKLNQRDEDARGLTYEQLPTKYVFRNHQWRKRKNNRLFLFGRIRSIHPRNKEVFAMRLLATVQKGPQSFQELRTVNGRLHPTFVSAAMELGLMNNQLEWDKCLEEATHVNSPITFRRLFASILVFNFVKHPRYLWEKYKEHCYDRNPTWTDERKEAHALYHIASFLKAHLWTLEEFGLPDVLSAFLPTKDHLVDDSGMLEPDRNEAKEQLQGYLDKLNPEQGEIFKRIMANRVNPDDSRPIFIQGSGGCGKTHLMSTLYYALVEKGHKVACVAHTGIAARLLPNGSTAHRMFHIPLEIKEDLRCDVKRESPEAVYLGEIDTFIWDEATMTDRRHLQAVHSLMVELHPENECIRFAGVKFIFGGDWKQTLPIVPNTQGAAVVNFTIRGSQLWQELEKFTLKENMRAKFDEPFAKWLARAGMGLENIDRNNTNVREEDQMMKLKFGTIVESEVDLMKAIFGDLKNPEENLKRFKSSAILAVDNKTTFDVNMKALRKTPGEMRTFLSVDEHFRNPEFSYLDPEIYHGETPTGMPPHALEVKIGCPVILLVNINTALGLVNGTRMIVDEITDHIIWAVPLNPTKNTPKRWPLTRMHFSPSQMTRIERAFQRTQFPIRLAYSMTINKSQGQTLDRVGILLRTPCFAHGQLYVALSRVRKSADLFIYNYHGNYEHLMEKKREEDEKKAKEEKRRERNRIKALRKKTTRSGHKKLHSNDDEASTDSSCSEVDEAGIVAAENKDQRQYTNNVVYASAIGN